MARRMNIQRTKSYGGTDVEVGATMHHNRSGRLSFGIDTECTSVEPEQWVGKVTLASTTLFTTEDAFGDPYQAAEGAEQQLAERLSAALSRADLT